MNSKADHTTLLFVLRSRLHARLRKNVRVNHAFSSVQFLFIFFWLCNKICFYIIVCQCQTPSDCARYPNTKCDGCNCVQGEIRARKDLTTLLTPIETNLIALALRLCLIIILLNSLIFTYIIIYSYNKTATHRYLYTEDRTFFMGGICCLFVCASR